jgi:hypothetical protein
MVSPRFLSELYDFAVGRVSEMLDDLKARYYAEEFPH